jgi:lipopolysaccharide transport system permease protein
MTFGAFFLYFRFILHSGSFDLSGYAVLLLPLLVVHTAVLSLGIGLLMSALTAKYRDLTHLTPLLMQVWMYATPVIYPLAKVPERWQWLAAINPMTPIVEAFRRVLLGTGTVRIQYLAWSVIASVLLAVSGLLLFGRVEKTFVDVV